MAKKRVLVVGAKGKMGLKVSEILKSDYEIVGVKRGDIWHDFKADLVIDFGSAESSVLSAEYAFKNKVPLIVGSTGQSDSDIKKIRRVSEVAPLMICSNFSVGVVLLKKCIDVLMKEKISDICIFEKHHRAKKDIPSGTAISIEKFISSKTNVPVQMLAERGGEEIGTHKVDFYFKSELISVSHTAFSRKVFAEGAAKAVDFLICQKEPKEYFFDDIIWQTSA